MQIQKIKQERCGNHAECRYTPVKVSFIPIKTPSHNGLLSRDCSCFMRSFNYFTIPPCFRQAFCFSLTGISCTRNKMPAAIRLCQLFSRHYAFSFCRKLCLKSRKPLYCLHYFFNLIPFIHFLPVHYAKFCKPFFSFFIIDFLWKIYIIGNDMILREVYPWLK